MTSIISPSTPEKLPMTPFRQPFPWRADTTLEVTSGYGLWSAGSLSGYPCLETQVANAK
jgi:hypothetical protein